MYFIKNINKKMSDRKSYYSMVFYYPVIEEIVYRIIPYMILTDIYIKYIFGSIFYALSHIMMHKNLELIEYLHLTIYSIIFGGIQVYIMNGYAYGWIINIVIHVINNYYAI